MQLVLHILNSLSENVSSIERLDLDKDDSSEIDEPIKWFSENHILHSFCKIDSNDKSIERIKRIASSAKVSLDELWGCHVEDDEWIKENINKIKTLIFVKVNDVSIYSKPGTKSVDIVSVGFNKNVLFDKLIC